MRKWIFLILGGVSSLSLLGYDVSFWFDKFALSAFHFLRRDSSKESNSQEPFKTSSQVLMEEINKLSKELTKTIRLLEEEPLHVVYESGRRYFPFSNEKWTLLCCAIFGSSVVVVLKRAFRLRLQDFWYVTRSCFITTTEKWLSNVHAISESIKQFYDDMSDNTSRISNRIQDNQEDMEQRLETDREECKRDISVITGDLLDVRQNLGKISLLLDSIQGSVALTNKGIEMLCQFVLQRPGNFTENIFIDQTIRGELRDMTNCLEWQMDEKKSPPH
ncbi:hypothetical protein GAYE_SCF54G6194 [Galdieria yellowstonensis]|uniref:Uncharacterized protein n=1 Tax=Galdieria yellowstonensis TaxID=3028027 RepID=A0AAV9ILA2_9RHOD|nr:hypothetical protein GAYE_SCF54G6194 [Galdieria yellowstonensis]